MYPHKDIEIKWQKEWEKKNSFRAVDFDKKPKYYVLVEFPYPSGEGLHVGHVRSYVAQDIVARQKRMRGFNVLYPIGWDAFGLPAENYAIKNKIKPRVAVDKNVYIFKKQIKALGISFDWSREVNTTDPFYYKWTQWIFCQLYKKGLAYKKAMPINWCPSCKIGLANEEVVKGVCERCGTKVSKKFLNQWMLKITAYADRLIEDLKKVDFLPRIKQQQINWIGRKKGLNITYKIGGIEDKITCFTTRPETNFGATFVVLAPEHELIQKITKQQYKERVKEYKQDALSKTVIDRTRVDREKSGVFTGSYAINPLSGEKMPIFIADYVLLDYGTGAVVGVPAHDKRDFQFAKKYNLKIIPVVNSLKQNIEIPHTIDEVYEDVGIMVNSGFLNGLNSQEAKIKIKEYLISKGLSQEAKTYSLRDWVFSRQHYWGEPIPIIYCDNCGEVLVPQKDLPVLLPDVESYEPTDTGESPLAKIDEWVKTKCPQCGNNAVRETDTMPNWAGSSWYFLRYIDPDNDEEFASMDKLKYWLSVDLYNGGMEHTTLHLLYSRFWHKFLYDINQVPTCEPYYKRVSHGMILAENGYKMSKSKGNVVNPDDVIEKYGADVLRLYEMFMGPYDKDIAWSEKTIKGVNRFVNKIWKIYESGKIKDIKDNNEVLTALNKMIKNVTDDLEKRSFNTAVSELMIFINCVLDNKEIGVDSFKQFLKIANIFIPHLAQELWQRLKGEGLIAFQKWPLYDDKYLIKDTVNIIVQINGKLRANLKVDKDTSQDVISQMAKKDKIVAKHLKGKEILKEVYAPNKFINFVVK